MVFVPPGRTRVTACHAQDLTGGLSTLFATACSIALLHSVLLRHGGIGWHWGDKWFDVVKTSKYPQ
jgi:hypothetical protein